MTIREKQLAQMAASRLQDFEDRAYAHVQQFWPQRCADMSKEETLQIIRSAISNAAKYGINSERDVVLFLNHMLSLSVDFDTNPAYPWVQSILNDPSMTGELKMEWLSRQTYRHLSERSEP